MNRDPFAPRLIRASAGSGKTHQLTNRYLGLLAAGVEADAILATTFTRKAAGEILDRVLERLAKAAEDAKEARDLSNQLGTGNGATSDYVRILRRMLRGLHRVRIGTLDSFYIALAASFSFELGLPAGWSICEDLDDARLRSEALEHLLERQPDDIWRLLPLLTKGETKRSVQGELHEVIQSHYDVFISSERSAWQSLHVPESSAEAERTQTLECLRAFDLSHSGHKRIPEARDKDIASFEAENWAEFIGSGLAAKVLAGETTYQRKEIPPQALAWYTILIRHARCKILRQLFDQTQATWDMLDGFHRELWRGKLATGALRFGEVTQALVEAMPALHPETLGFRLDGAIDHLLLDEFQDTSLSQWDVLRPIAEGITSAKPESRRSFFCVGDVKQAIFGWRGGMAEILNALPNSLGKLDQQTLSVSRRSAQPIIDVVNQVFEHLNVFQPGDKHSSGMEAWGKRFEKHTTAKKDLAGYVRLHTGPTQEEGQSLDDHRAMHCEFVAKEIKLLAQQAPGRTIGVLCRKNETVAQMIYELRKIGVSASEEGGNPLTDSSAVEVILSLFTLADHPGHSIAYFHLKNSPLKEELQSFQVASDLSRELRRRLLADRYGPFTQHWAESLAPACDKRDLSRLQQLIEMAYAFQPRSTLRADDFVAWVRSQRVPDPSGANVRVMTMHGAKGLQFDAVFLPELDAGLLGQPPSFVVGRDPKDLSMRFVCRYASEAVQELLTDKEREAFELDRQQRVEESLSLLYVAMTRAIHAMYLYIPGPRTKKDSDAWYNLLLATLAPGQQERRAEKTLLFERGEASWFVHGVGVPPASPPLPKESITFKPVDADRRRGMDHVAPSRREGQARVKLGRLLQPSEGTGAATGTLYHAWFELIDWLDDGEPMDAALRATAHKVGMSKGLPKETWRDVDRLLANFRAWLGNPEIRSVLRRSAYADPKKPGFPASLASIWNPRLVPQSVQRERRFLVPDGAQFWNGSIDRIVWLGEGDSTVAADVIDFKTDAIEPGNAKALAERMEHYRPQLEAYRRAVARLAQLPEERIATRLVFTNAGRVVEVDAGMSSS
jgi:ATP-dependent exoDNAse (exonuclease V) beta subunit